MKKPLLLVFPWLLAPLTAASAQNEVPAQLVLKQDFEKTDSAAEWRQWLSTGVPSNSLTRDSTPLQSHAGQAALKYEITSESGDERFIICGAKLPGETDLAGRTLRVRFFARTTNPTPENQQVVFRVLERSGPTVTGWIEKKNDLLPLQLSGQWQEFTATGQLSPTSRGLTLYFAFKKPRPGQNVWIDDLSVEVVPPTIP